MAIQDDINLRLSAQRALLTHITANVRAVSVDVIPEKKQAWIRFVFDGEPTPAEEEMASVAETEILTDFVDEWTLKDGWKVELELIRCPVPARIEHRRIAVYERCEDPWVIDPNYNKQDEYHQPI